ncbi:MAG: hypothetical protein HYZ21_05495 [Chloroflexi bacterium]|nr:hypothetical protein [Chloroflexota bacterium]
MSIDFNNLLITLAFLLPGFLTSRLISARTPAMGRQASTFQETLESLLRSVYIHLVLMPFFSFVVWHFFVRSNIYVLKQIQTDGMRALYAIWPFETVLFLFLWLLAAFLLAVLFGYKWDPLNELTLRLANYTGTKSFDLFYQLRQSESDRQNARHQRDQLWVQARLKNGFVYRGKLVFAGYRHDGMSRELMLADVKFYASDAQMQSQPYVSILYDYVLIEFANCESLEVLFGLNK